MPDSIHAPCPLCNLQCTAYLEDYGKWMHFSCRCCRELKVNKMVISKLRAESNEVREELSQQARALRDGEYLHIAATGIRARCCPEGNLLGQLRCGRGPCEAIVPARAFRATITP